MLRQSICIYEVSLKNFFWEHTVNEKEWHLKNSGLPTCVTHSELSKI